MRSLHRVGAGKGDSRLTSAGELEKTAIQPRSNCCWVQDFPIDFVILVMLYIIHPNPYAGSHDGSVDVTQDYDENEVALATHMPLGLSPYSSSNMFASARLPDL